MKTKISRFPALSLAVAAMLVTLNAQQSTLNAQGTTFAYQGRLVSNGSPASGTYDVRFAVFNAGSGGAQIGNPLTNAAVVITNGLFAATLDFGAGVFDGNPRWLEVSVRTNSGGLGAPAFTTLAPRQPVIATPYSITAGNLTGTLPAAQVTGALSAAQLPPAVITNNATTVVLNGAFAGNGGALTNVNLLTANAYGAILWTTNQTFYTAALPGLATNYPALAADLNGDGKVDLLSSDSLGGLMVLTNNGHGSFSQSALLNAGSNPYYVLTGDVNGNGKTDLIFPATFYDNTNSTVLTTVLTLTNKGAGVFFTNAVSTINLGSLYWGGSFAAADVNGDGKVDLLVASQSPDQCYLFVLTNNGSGNFVSNSAVNLGFDTYPTKPRVADVNGDGKPDVIVQNTMPFALLVFTNNGHGSLVPSYSLSGLSGGSFTVADVNNDSRMDLLVADTLGTLTVLTNNGSGVFGVSTTNSLPQNVGYPITAADMNGDGKLEVVAGSYANTLTVFTNNGTSGFSLSAVFNLPDYPQSIVPADINGNGKMDLISEAYSSITVLTNTGWFIAANFNASQLTVGTVPLAQLPTCLVTNYETGVTLSGTFNATSDRNAKQNFAAVNPLGVLDKVAALPISEWNYKADAVNARHLGPMAQDFRAAFGLGANNTSIATVDEEGVALAAIQGLNQKMEVENAALRAENAALQARLERLEQLVSQKNGGAK